MFAASAVASETCAAAAPGGYVSSRYGHIILSEVSGEIHLAENGLPETPDA
jgi:hypothetical protein